MFLNLNINILRAFKVCSHDPILSDPIVLDPIVGLYEHPVWKVCIAQPRYRARNFDALYIFTSKLLNFGCAVFTLSSQDEHA